MDEKEKIPVLQVLDDMYSDKSGVSSAARDYYYLNYATKDEKNVMDRNDKITSIIGIIVLSLIIVSLVLCLCK